MEIRIKDKMNLQIKINDDFLENIIKDTMISDYRNLNDQIDSFYVKYENVEMEDIPSFAKENLKDSIKYRDALEIILEYYLTSKEYKKQILEED